MQLLSLYTCHKQLFKLFNNFIKFGNKFYIFPCIRIFGRDSLLSFLKFLFFTPMYHVHYCEGCLPFFFEIFKILFKGRNKRIHKKLERRKRNPSTKKPNQLQHSIPISPDRFQVMAMEFLTPHSPKKEDDCTMQILTQRIHSIKKIIIFFNFLL